MTADDLVDLGVGLAAIGGSLAVLGATKKLVSGKKRNKGIFDCDKNLKGFDLNDV